MDEPIKRSFISGVLYTGIAKYLGVIITLVVSGILSRLIAPKEFGVVAIATVLINFLSLVADLGISPAIIQSQELNKKDYNALFILTIWLGGILGVSFFLSAPIIAHYFNNESLVTVCQVLSLNLFFGAANIIPNGLIYKKKRFKFISIRTIILQLTTGAIAIYAAFKGAGIYALLINPTLTAIGLFAVNYQQYPLSIWVPPTLESIRKIFKFSAFQFLFNIINFFSRNLDKILIGKSLGMIPLGFYDKSYRLMMMPLENITNVISPVMFPILSEYQKEPHKLTDAYLRIIQLLAFIGFPLSVALFFNAQELILLIFGPQWEPAVKVFQILSLTVGIQIILSSSGAIYQATNNTQWLFVSGILSTLFNLCAILWGVYIKESIEAVAWALAFTFTLNFFQCYLLLFKKCLEVDLIKFIKVITHPLLFSTILGVFFLPIYYLCRDFPLILSLIIKCGVIGCTTLAYIHWAKVFDIRSIIHRVRNR